MRAGEVPLSPEPQMTARSKELGLGNAEAKIAKQEEGRYWKYLTGKLQPESGTVCTDMGCWCIRDKESELRSTWDSSPWRSVLQDHLPRPVQS